MSRIFRMILRVETVSVHQNYMSDCTVFIGGMISLFSSVKSSCCIIALIKMEARESFEVESHCDLEKRAKV